MYQNKQTEVTNLETFNFSEKSTPIRVQVINNEPWFVAKDVCEALEHSNHRMAVKLLEEDSCH